MAATNEFMHHLSMAACEWFLMLLMYIEAALGFILTRFAHQCELQTPCLYCFRFDHVFGDRPDSYLTHFCNKHRAEVSCLIACDLHHKLSDVREMCDDCFMSIANAKRDQVSRFKPFLNKNFERSPSSTGLCSCCKRPWKPKPRPQVKLGVKKLSMHPPLPGRYRRRSLLKKARDKISGTMTPCSVESSIHVDTDIDALSDSGCADLKFNSCSSESGDSFYEIECENDGFEDFSCVIIHKAKSFNTTRTSKSITSPLSSTSSGLTKHGVEQNGSPEFNLDLHSVNDDIEQNGSPDFNQDLHSVNNDVEQNGSPGFNQDLHSVASSSSSDKHEGYESPGKHSVSNFKNNYDIEKLKRQMEHDQEQLRLLHRELEEERNAAAIAADEAMAMITRLQEEKSALHMEALQYLRMMDEQAEYDMEALDKANDLITEKDKEIQDIEAELEFFRSRYDDETVNFKENHMGNGETLNLLDLRVSNNNPVLDLEDEKTYVLQSLLESEKKLSNGDKSLQQSEIENEVLDLNDWLEAVESDRDFLEHACNTVQSHVGLEFIQEIARHLHDLRRARFDRRCQTVD